MSFSSPLILIHMLSSYIEGIFLCQLFPVLFASNQIEGFKLKTLKSLKEEEKHVFYNGDLTGFTKSFLIPCLFCFEACKGLGNYLVNKWLMK